MRKTQLIAAALIAAGALLATSTSFAETVVVVSSKSGATNLTADQVSEIFLGRLATLPGGGQAVPVDWPEGAPIREEFYTKVMGKTAAQLKAHWAKQIFTGKGQPPKEVADAAGIKKLIAENPNIVGYMGRQDVDASVKVLFSIK
jgi:ABC-type phosphate transport system substrate-binding protein